MEGLEEGTKKKQTKPDSNISSIYSSEVQRARSKACDLANKRISENPFVETAWFSSASVLAMVSADVTESLYSNIVCVALSVYLLPAIQHL